MNATIPSQSPETSVALLTVVGIGASAGGLKALQQFVEAVPADSGMAFVVILHLDPERGSRMAELLQDRTLVKVTQVRGPERLEADHIYVIPPGPRSGAAQLDAGVARARRAVDARPGGPLFSHACRDVRRGCGRGRS